MCKFRNYALMFDVLKISWAKRVKSYKWGNMLMLYFVMARDTDEDSKSFKPWDTLLLNARVSTFHRGGQGSSPIVLGKRFFSSEWINFSYALRSINTPITVGASGGIHSCALFLPTKETWNRIAHCEGSLMSHWCRKWCGVTWENQSIKKLI